MEASSIPPGPPDRLARLAKLAAKLRVEDWLLVGWIGLVAPLMARSDASQGPFDPGRPLEGSLALVGVLGAVVCLITGRSDAPPGTDSSVLKRASVGPLTGGLLLVLFSGSAGLGLGGLPGEAAGVAAIVLLVGVRLLWPAIPTATRRLLVTPFILVAGGIFGNIVHQVTGGSSPPGATVGVGFEAIAFEVGVLAVFSAVYYAMLIYAPRQVAEPEGGPLAWLTRYALFLAGVIIGVVWLRPLGI